MIIRCRAGNITGFGHLVRTRVLAKILSKQEYKIILIGPNKNYINRMDKILFWKWIEREDWEIGRRQERKKGGEGKEKRGGREEGRKRGEEEENSGGSEERRGCSREAGCRARFSGGKLLQNLFPGQHDHVDGASRVRGPATR